jgi:hypothetical protein
MIEPFGHPELTGFIIPKCRGSVYIKKSRIKRENNKDEGDCQMGSFHAEENFLENRNLIVCENAFIAALANFHFLMDTSPVNRGWQSIFTSAMFILCTAA